MEEQHVQDNPDVSQFSFEPEAARHKVRGEEPSDEMRRKGLGEEPSLAIDSDLPRKGQRISDVFVIELFAGTARLTKCLKRCGFQAMAFDKTSKRSEGQVILEADLSNREEVNAFLDFVRLKASQIATFTWLLLAGLQAELEERG